MSKKAPQRTFACPSSPLYRPDRFTNLVARHINYHNMVLHNKTPRKPNNKQLIIKLNNKTAPTPTPAFVITVAYLLIAMVEDVPS
ncbi:MULTISPECIES: hypothetical protein [Serratia]|uniref:hypothetical protein n=1 Tax=Serratia TaxID=613 RepID=UPI000AFF4849|nr:MULTISPECIES: hypothetical protein [Serratia]EMD6652598.1 hypothetical protein [Serratia marcescens]MBD8464109.1 hypothetical protein [Serratia marcescens]MCK1088191.1 hypothetical protein [Serratia marcescens]MCT4801911.1 hypothetical protein [Serratia marcescens]MDH2249824.1 hypothetical protein [Serratia marcescens]